MDIRTPNRSDWQQFRELVAAEGWRVPMLEYRLLQSAWQQDAGVLVDCDRFSGLVTAVTHERSGWVGNLIVPAELRGKGYGHRLFRWAVGKLLDQGVTTAWLTASELGRPMYEQEGFQAVDRVERWILPAGVRAGTLPAENLGRPGLLQSLDRLAWGEDRQVFLEALLPNGDTFVCNESVALLQKGAGMQIIGPWYSDDLCPRSNRILLQQLFAAADPSVEIVADVIASSPIRSLWAASGFEPSGVTTLMACGDTDYVATGKMVALASLGSCL